MSLYILGIPSFAAAQEVIDEFHPAVCAGQSLQAAITLAGLSIKAGFAVRAAGDTGCDSDLRQA